MEHRYQSTVDYYLPGRVLTLLPDPMEDHLVVEESHPLQDHSGQVGSHLVVEEAECLPVVMEEEECLPVEVEEHLHPEDHLLQV